MSYSNLCNIAARRTNWPEGMADLISYETKLKAISGPTKCSKGVVIFDTLQKEIVCNMTQKKLSEGVPRVIPYEECL